MSVTALDRENATATAGGPLSEVRGQQRRRVPPGPLKVLQIVTGYLFFRWLVTLAGRHLFGYRVESALSYNGRRLHYTSRTWLMGREIRSAEEFLLARDLVSVGVESRYPQIVLLVGALGLIIGAMVGIGWVIDGIQASYVPIALVGLGVLALGVVFDIAMGALGDYLGRRDSLLVSVRAGQGLMGLLGRRFRVVGIPSADARAFVQQIADR